MTVATTSTSRSKSNVQGTAQKRLSKKTKVKAKQLIVDIDLGDIKGGINLDNTEELTPAQKKVFSASNEVNLSAQEMDDAEVHGQDDIESNLVEAERRGFEDMPWYLNDIPKKDRLRTRDIVYNADLDRFGIFIAPARKPSLSRMRLLKVGSKTEVYTRDWFVPFESLVLVSRNGQVKRVFVETDKEYVRRAGKIVRKDSAVSE